jgi:ketosteroid isomerase-like protein
MKDTELRALCHRYLDAVERRDVETVAEIYAPGFVARDSVNVVEHSGRRTSLWACVVARCRDGRITRIDEYLDAGKFRLRGRRAS